MWGSPGNPAQHRTHASAWEIWIFEVEKSTGECNSWWIFWISKFFKFSSFLMIPKLKFSFLAWFAAQEWLQIDLGWNLKNIKFFSNWSFLTFFLDIPASWFTTKKSNLNLKLSWNFRSKIALHRPLFPVLASSILTKIISSKVIFSITASKTPIFQRSCT